MVRGLPQNFSSVLRRHLKGSLDEVRGFIVGIMGLGMGEARKLPSQYGALPQTIGFWDMLSYNKKHLKNVRPIRHCEPPHALI